LYPPKVMHHRQYAVVVACVVAVSACSQTKPAEEKAATKTPAAPWVTVQPLDVPVTTLATMPQLTRAGRGVTLSWVETSDNAASLRFAEWTGDKWSGVSTAATGKNWFQSWADVPSVTRLSSGALVANWFVNTKPEEEAYDMLLSYSKDEGRTWAKPFKPHRDRTQTQHGFASIVEMPDHAPRTISAGQPTCGCDPTCASPPVLSPSCSSTEAPARGWRCRIAPHRPPLPPKLMAGGRLPAARLWAWAAA